MRVRLGGYSLRQGDAPIVDIPRVHTDAGWRFDHASLAARLQGRRYAAAQVSYMADVAAEDLIAAVHRLAPACDSIAITLP